MKLQLEVAVQCDLLSPSWYTKRVGPAMWYTSNDSGIQTGLPLAVWCSLGMPA